MLAGLDGSLQFVLMNFRLAEDSAHRALRHAPSIDDAEAHFAQDGREFRPPTATAARAEADGTVREHGTVVRNAPIRSNERLAGVGDEAYLWRGYTNNQRGVVKFRSGRFVGEVNAPSVEEAKLLAVRLVELTK
jgi:hypothetical protein